MENKGYYLNFYGIYVFITGDLSISQKLKNDFAYFHTEKQPQKTNIILNIQFTKPSFNKIPPVNASMYKNNCICYDKNGIRYSVYSNKAVAQYSIKSETVTIESEDYNLLYEISYLYIHSRVGENLDMCKIHRIHACSFSYKNNVFVCILPQGAGKSTLLNELIKNKEIKIISDDTPLINHKGQILPFPIRIGLCEDSDFSFIPKEYISSFKRQNFEEKKLINYSFFKDRIEKRSLPVIILCGKRTFKENAEFVSAGRFYVFKELFKCTVIGYGLPQVIEYFITGGLKDIFKKAYISLLRTYACIKLIISAKQIYNFYIGFNKKQNAEYLIKFFDEHIV